jgi:hypothetical protein
VNKGKKRRAEAAKTWLCSGNSAAPSLKPKLLQLAGFEIVGLRKQSHKSVEASNAILYLGAWNGVSLWRNRLPHPATCLRGE